MPDIPPEDFPPRSRPRRKDPLGPESEIRSRLRELYSEVESEPIPSSLVELLERLSEAERGGGDK